MQTIPPKIQCQDVNWMLRNGHSFLFTVARLDLLHPFISGNKYFKLKYNLQQAIQQQKQGILTMGGAYSNHLAATAFACNEQGFISAGIIRGEIQQPLNSTLSFCTKQHMQLIAVSRKEYASTSAAVKQIIARHPHLLFVPEGGNNEEGFNGCKEILQQVEKAASFTHIVCAVGTGTTFKGIAVSASAHQTVIGIPVLKIREEEQDAFIQHHISPAALSKQQILFGHAGKGYGRTDELLINFINSFYTKTSIPTDIVYTGKLMQAVISLAEQGYFPAESKVLVIHSGGLQGNNSLSAETLLF
ncbi:MAG: pyridoxal-phosphate dependent enzyme [Chitinophagaceae bacterium]|nr:pyridoxal-phosphate dependent enzyme [Chitinophagaceae bacterium]